MCVSEYLFLDSYLFISLFMSMVDRGKRQPRVTGM